MAYDQTLVQIRERTFQDVLDLALVVIRRQPVTLGLAALVGIAPFAALNAWLMTVPDVPIGLPFYLLFLEAPWATAPLTVVLGGLMFGERSTIGGVLKALARSFVPMLIYQFLVRGGLLVSVVFYPLVPTRLAFLNEVLLLERGRWLKAVQRSSTICGTRGSELFGQWLAQLVFGALFVACFWQGTGALAHALGGSELTWDEPEWSDVRGLRFQFALWLAIAYFAVARFFQYIDNRIRLEGWEVELRLRSVGRALEESQRW